jgi:carbamoyltransferase
MAFLGISAFFHDSAAALVSRDGEILAAVQEERFSRVRHDPRFPENAISFCLEQARKANDPIQKVVYYERPDLKLTRIAKSFKGAGAQHNRRFHHVLNDWSSWKLFLQKTIPESLHGLDPSISWTDCLYFSSHHGSHAASAFFPSPFNEAAILTTDGVGESITTSIAYGSGASIRPLKSIHYPHSLGLLFSAFTYYLGFRVNSGEYKVMGLAPYGKPSFTGLICEKLINLRCDGSFALNPDFFQNFISDIPIDTRFIEVFGRPRREEDDALDPFHCDVAASLQVVINNAVEALARESFLLTGSQNLCLSGGVALNCVTNGRLLQAFPGKNIWIQPAAGDAGGALGAALACHSQASGSAPVPSKRIDGMRGSLLGPEFSNCEIETWMKNNHASYRRLQNDELLIECADILAQGKVIGWFQGRMEFGPRALGSRSILADPRHPGIHRDLNLRIKKRESFRPFAPSVLEDECSAWFDLATPSPYMLFVAPVCGKKRRKANQVTDNHASCFLETEHSEIPAVTHVDFSARVQTVGADSNPRYLALLKAFYQRTGCPVLLNTSFNVRGEPIVCSPADAFACFINSGIDYLCIGDFLLNRTDQDHLCSLAFARSNQKD